jgi:hypothetical protein
MNRTTKQEIIQNQLAAYLAADKKQKTVILDLLYATTGYQRKALVRRSRQLQRQPRKVVDQFVARAGPKTVYGADVTAALKQLWDVSHELSGERLHPAIATYVAVLVRGGHWLHGKDTTDKLLAMSLITVKRRIAGFRKEQGMPRPKGLGSTKPSELKELIPIRRGPWDNPKPGYGEIDTVVHCGSSLQGDLAYTVQYTDVATLWVLLAAQWNKGQKATRNSIEHMRERLPFPLQGLDPDSGSEFVNWHLYDWCSTQNIQLTRIRPGKKNDHGRVEQKNYANVRQFVGYIRLDKKEQAALLGKLYQTLELYLNYFIPSQKCIRKERSGPKYKRIYDQAQTPYARALAHTDIPETTKDRLQAIYETLDLAALKQQLDDCTELLLRSAR